MNSTTTRLPPVQQRTFKGSEVWIILRAIGAIPAEAAVTPEIAPDTATLDMALVMLQQQGLLAPASQGRVALGADLERLIRPATFPDRVWMVNVRDPRTTAPSQLYCLGWTPEGLTVNWVNSVNEHQFELYGPKQPERTIWEHLMAWCDLDLNEQTANTPAPTPTAFEQLAAKSSQVVMVTAISAVKSPRRRASSVGWLVSNKTAWLLRPGSTPDKLEPRLADRNQIQAAIEDLVSRTVTFL